MFKAGVLFIMLIMRVADNVINIRKKPIRSGLR